MNAQMPPLRAPSSLVRRMLRRRLARAAVMAVAIVVVLVTAAVVGVRWWRAHHPNGLLAAINAMPVATQRLSFTDWSAVRSELGVRPSRAVGDMSDWLQRAFTADVSSASTIAAEATSIQQHFGFSPANVEWEAYGQAPSGQVTILRLDDGVSFGDLRAHLRRDRYPLTGGVWEGGADVVASLDPSLPPELGNIVLMPDRHLVLASSSLSYLADAVAAIKGHQPSLNSVGSLTGMVGHFGEPAAAVLWVRDFACSDLAMSSADPTAQTQAQQAIAAAGQTTPLVGFALVLGRDGVLTAAEQFTSPDVAKGDLKARATLATGPEYGRSEASFSDDFRLLSAATKGSTVLLRMRASHSGVFPLSSLYSGPLVFATC